MLFLLLASKLLSPPFPSVYPPADAEIKLVRSPANPTVSYSIFIDRRFSLQSAGNAVMRAACVRSNRRGDRKIRRCPPGGVELDLRSCSTRKQHVARGSLAPSEIRQSRDHFSARIQARDDPRENCFVCLSRFNVTKFHRDDAKSRRSLSSPVTLLQDLL